MSVETVTAVRPEPDLVAEGKVLVSFSHTLVKAAEATERNTSKYVDLFRLRRRMAAGEGNRSTQVREEGRLVNSINGDHRLLDGLQVLPRATRRLQFKI